MNGAIHRRKAYTCLLEKRLGSCRSNARFSFRRFSVALIGCQRRARRHYADETRQRLCEREVIYKTGFSSSPARERQRHRDLKIYSPNGQCIHVSIHARCVLKGALLGERFLSRREWMLHDRQYLPSLAFPLLTELHRISPIPLLTKNINVRISLVLSSQPRACALRRIPTYMILAATNKAERVCIYRYACTLTIGERRSASRNSLCFRHGRYSPEAARSATA